MMNLQEIFTAPSKANVEEKAAALVQVVLEQGDIAEVWARVETMKLWAETVQEKLREHIVANPPSDTFKTHGVKIEVTYRKTYEYKHDATWSGLSQMEKSAAEARKGREQFLKALTEPLADPQTGELIEPAQILETKAVVKTTFPK